MRCGMGSGKSWGIAMAAALVGEMRPGENTLCVTDTRRNLERFLQPALELLLGGAGWRWCGEATKQYWRHPNGHRCWLAAYKTKRGAGAQSAAGQGVTCTAFFADECQELQPGLAEFAVGRCRAKGYRPLFGFSGLPVAGAWWVDFGRQLGWIDLQATTRINLANQPPEYLETLRLALPIDEFERLVENRPRPPTGQVWSRWSSDPWPDGNIVHGWRYSTDMVVTATIDWGKRHPSLLLIATDPELEIDVVFDELHPDELPVEGLIERALDRAWPRQHESDLPAGHQGVLVDRSCADPSGIDEIRVWQQSPTAVGLSRGLGTPVFTERDSVKHRIVEGVSRVDHRICGPGGNRLLVCTDELWRHGRSHGGRSFRKMIESLKWNLDPRKSDTYEKDLHDHCADALRYWAVNFHWFDIDAIKLAAPNLMPIVEPMTTDLIGEWAPRAPVLGLIRSDPIARR